MGGSADGGSPITEKDLAAMRVEAKQRLENYPIYELVLAERQRQDSKWGEQNHDPHTWNTILVEEIGEISKAILHNQFGSESFDHIAVELIQSIAVAYAMLECFDRHEMINLRTLILDA